MSQAGTPKSGWEKRRPSRLSLVPSISSPPGGDFCGGSGSTGRRSSAAFPDGNDEEASGRGGVWSVTARKSAYLSSVARRFAAGEVGRSVDSASTGMIAYAVSAEVKASASPEATPGGFGSSWLMGGSSVREGGDSLLASSLGQAKFWPVESTGASQAAGASAPPRERPSPRGGGGGAGKGGEDRLCAASPGPRVSYSKRGALGRLPAAPICTCGKEVLGGDGVGEAGGGGGGGGCGPACKTVAKPPPYHHQQPTNIPIPICVRMPDVGAVSQSVDGEALRPGEGAAAEHQLQAVDTGRKGRDAQAQWKVVANEVVTHNAGVGGVWEATQGNPGGCHRALSRRLAIFSASPCRDIFD